MNIRKNLLPESLKSWKFPYPMNPEFIVVHNTANDASADNEVKYMHKTKAQGGKQVSYHYAVDDKEIVQALEENVNGWHAGDGAKGKGNRCGIAIEICYSKSGGPRFDQAEENAVELIVDILKRYGWGIDKVMKHQDFYKKYCPHRTLDKGWNRFIDMVEAKLAPAKPAVKPEVKPVEPAKSFFTSKGYFSRGDRHENINKVSVFMRRVFPSYTSAKAIGSLYGPYIEKAIKTFQKNAKKAGRYNDKVDGYLGPKTLRALETYGFRY